MVRAYRGILDGHPLASRPRRFPLPEILNAHEKPGEDARRLPLLWPVVALATGISLRGDFSSGGILAASAALAAITLLRRGGHALTFSIVTLAFATGVLLGSTDDGHARPLEAIDELRASPVARSLDETFSPRAAAFARAILLGDRAGLDPLDRKIYRETGMTHLLAISGLHVGLLALVFWCLARVFFGAGRLAEGAAAAVTLYVLAIGAPASALRAALMAVLVFLARALGRPSSTLNALLAAAFLALLFSPSSLFNIGFQLSYAATIGLVLWTAPVEKLLPERPRWIRRGIAATVAAQLGTVPLMIEYFRQFSPVAFLSNLACIPIFTLELLAILAGLAGIPFAAPAEESLRLVSRDVVASFALLPGASFAVSAPPPFFVAGCAVLLLLPLAPRIRGARLFLGAGGLALALMPDPSPVDGVWLLPDRASRGATGGLLVRDSGSIAIFDRGISADRWNVALSDLGADRVDTLVILSPGGLVSPGAANLLFELPVGVIEIPGSWNRDAEIAARIDELKRLGVAIRSDRAEPLLSFRDRTLSPDGSEL